MIGLDFLTDSPPNAGVPLSRLDGRPLGQDMAYLRNSFDAPAPGEVRGEIELIIPGRAPRTVTAAGNVKEQMENELRLLGVNEFSIYGDLASLANRLKVAHDVGAT